MGQLNVLENQNLYGNLLVYSPDMIPMFYTSQRRINFYLKNNLAEEIAPNEYRLLFQPKGLAHSAQDKFSPLCLRENKCVVSGVQTNLTKHHIVPSTFRKHFPVEKKRPFILVVLLERQIHADYTRLQEQFYSKLAEKYGVERTKALSMEQNEESRARGIAHALLNYSSTIPMDVQEGLKKEFTDITDCEPTNEILEQYKKPFVRPAIDNFGKLLMEKVTDYDEFERIWLDHFLEHTNPQFLPKDIIEKYNLSYENQTNI